MSLHHRCNISNTDAAIDSCICLSLLKEEMPRMIMPRATSQRSADVYGHLARSSEIALHL